MWTCTKCKRTFTRDHQAHSCNDKSIADFLKNRSDDVIAMYDHFVRELSALGDVQIRATKTAIALTADVRLGDIRRIGKDFIDICLYFDKAYEDNLCFYKIANVPGSTQHNHYFRMFHIEDLNEEVLKFMKMAVDRARRD